MSDDKKQADDRTAEQILKEAEPEVQSVVKKTLQLARASATGNGTITKDDVIEVIRNVVK